MSEIWERVYFIEALKFDRNDRVGNGYLSLLELIASHSNTQARIYTVCCLIINEQDETVFIIKISKITNISAL